jgi:hypothetical protein
MDKLNTIISKRIDVMFDTGADYFDIYELETVLDYFDIINIWSEYEYKKYYEMFGIEDKLYDETKKPHINIVKICKDDIEFSLILENLFDYHFNYKYEDMLLFYFKNSNFVLVKLKSYYPYFDMDDDSDLNSDLKYYNEKTSPYWNIFIENEDLIADLSNYIKELSENSLCILGY